MTVRVLFFDVGGVLGTNGWDRTHRRRAVERFGLDAEEFADRHECVVADLETGKMSFEEYLDWTVFHRERPFTRDEFRAFVWSRSQPYPEVLDLVDRIGGRLLLATLNNESRELNEYRIERFGLRRWFRLFFSSCYVGMRKPEPEIYRLAVDVVNLDPSECLFVDDRAINVERASAEGIDAVRFGGDVAALERELTLRGVEVR